MAPLDVEAVDVLIHHAERLSASLYATYRQLANPEDRSLSSKNISELLKFMQQKKDINDKKCPHLPKEQVVTFGQQLRTPFLCASHLLEFRRETVSVLSQIVSESTEFNLSWNYVYTTKALKLFVAYVRIILLAYDIPDFDKAISLYSYCHQIATSKKLPNLQELLGFFDKPINLEDELSPFVERVALMFKGINGILLKILDSQQFDWHLLLMRNNPQPLAKKSTFFKSEYVILCNFRLLCDTLMCAVMTSPDTILIDQIIPLVSIVITHQPRFQLFADSSIDIAKALEGLKKTKKKFNQGFLKNIPPENERLKPIRETRLVYLIKVLSEMYSVMSGNPTAVPEKLIVIQAALAYADFEMRSTMTNPIAHPILMELLDRVTKFMSIALNFDNDIIRYAVFNLREYDGPFLSTYISSFEFPAGTADLVQKLTDSLMKLSIQHIDRDGAYDLRQLELFIEKTMAAFNKVSDQISHLMSMLNLLSAIYFRVKLVNNSRGVFLDAVPLHTYWAYTDFLIQNLNDSQHSNSVIAIYDLFHYFTFDASVVAEYAHFEQRMRTILGKIDAGIQGLLIEWFKAREYHKISSLFSRAKLSGCIQLFDEEVIIVDRILLFIPEVIKAALKADPWDVVAYQKQVSEMYNIYRVALQAVETNPRFSNDRNVRDLSYVGLTISPDSIKVDELGYFPSIYRDLVKEFLEKDIDSTFYSLTFKQFLSKDGSQKAEKLTSKAALHALTKIIGVNGLMMIDSVVLDVISSFQPSKDSISSLIRLGSLIMFREHLKDSDSEQPHLDLCLMKALQNNSFVTEFGEESHKTLLSTIFKSDYWVNVEFSPLHDSFVDNSHLITKALDAIYGAVYAKNQQLTPQRLYSLSISTIASTLRTCVENAPKQKKGKKRTVISKKTMWFFVDHLVRDSCYADYSLSAKVVDYQILRNAYTRRFTKISAEQN